MDVTIVGPVWDASGYAYHTRTVALWLHRLGATVRLRTVAWGVTRVALTPPTRRLLHRMLRRGRRPGRGPVLQIVIGSWFRKWRGRPCLGWTMLETDRIGADWVARCNAMDEVWVPTHFNLETFTQSGVAPGKLRLVPLGTNPRRFHPGVPPLSVPGRRGFAFLSNFEWIPRKGYDVLLRAYVEEFSGDDDVSLILKSYDNSAYDPAGARIRAEVERIAGEVGNPRPPHVMVLTQVLSPAQMPSLYTAADCYVLPTRGEGWNHPALEASACGVPVITTRWSGHLEFLNDENAYLIPIHGLEPVPSAGIPNDGVYNGSRWAIPSVGETRRLMRHVFHHREEARRVGRRARETAAGAFTWKRSARLVHRLLRRWG